jgi:hypothetical protein
VLTETWYSGVGASALGSRTGIRAAATTNSSIAARVAHLRDGGCSYVGSVGETDV